MNVEDKEWGYVSLGAFGTYDFKINAPAKFIENIVASMPSFTSEAIADQIRNVVSAKASTAIARSGVPILQMDGNKEEFASTLHKTIQGIKSNTLSNF